jgi:hypothetical protein
MLVGFAAYKSDGFGSSLGAVLRSLFVTKLVFLFGTDAAYCAALLLAANKLGLWHTSAIKATIYWFFNAARWYARCSSGSGHPGTWRLAPVIHSRPHRRLCALPLVTLN